MAIQTRTQCGRNVFYQSAGLNPSSQTVLRQQVARCDLVRLPVGGGVWNTSSMGFHSDRDANQENTDRTIREFIGFPNWQTGAVDR